MKGGDSYGHEVFIECVTYHLEQRQLNDFSCAGIQRVEGQGDGNETGGSGGDIYFEDCTSIATLRLHD